MSWPSSSPMPSSAPTTSPAPAIRRHTPDDSPTRSKSSASRSRSHPRPPDPADPHTAAQPRNCPLSRNSDSRVRHQELNPFSGVLAEEVEQDRAAGLGGEAAVGVVEG